VTYRGRHLSAILKPGWPGRGHSPRGDSISTLTPKQLAHLRSLAHPLKPFLRVGKEGLTESAERAFRDALATRELLKAKVLEASPQSAREIGAALAERLEGAQLVQVVGRTFVLYRPHPQSPKIALPD
jgi:RNA-binding protein